MNDFLQSLRNNQAEKPRTPKTRKNSENSYNYSSGPKFNSYGGGGGYSNNRNPQMKRQPASGIPHQSVNQMPVEDQGMTLLADALDNLSTQVDALTKNQEYLITVQERTADLLQRQADAIEIVMSHLNISPMSTPEPPAFENHYLSSQEPEEELNGTVEELLKAELEAERKKNEALQAKPVLRRRRKVVSKPAPKSCEQSAPVKSTPKQSAVTRSQTEAELLPRDVVLGIINDMRKEGATYDQVAKRLVELGQPTFSGRGEWHAQTIHRLCSKK